MKSNRIVLFVVFISIILLIVLTNKNAVKEGYSSGREGDYSSSSAGNGGSGGYGGHGGFNGMYGNAGSSYGRGFTNHYEGNSCMT
jgi:hypothetical protein